jgi:hypothetical protein
MDPTVLSSTFSSNQRLPGGPAVRVWLLALGLVVASIGAWELYWRAAGVRASARDPAAYVVARARLDSRSTILLGTSKMQSDVDPRVWANALGQTPPVLLAVAGSSPVPLLELLAADPDYRGTVVMEILPRIVFASTAERERAVLAYEESYHEASRSPAEWTEARLQLLVSSSVVFRRSGLRLRDAVRAVQRGRRPPIPDFRMRRDRFFPLVFQPETIQERADGTLRRMRAAAGPAQGAQLDSIIERVGRAVLAIQRRGGKVVFVVLPGSGPVRAYEDDQYPRARYADVLATRTPAVMINAEDHPALSGFDCPDGSHLAAADTPRFTQALAEIIRQRLEPAVSR